MLAWLTTASPSSTMPSTGMEPPSRTTTRSPSRTSESGTLVSTPSASTQAVSTLRARLSVRLAMERRRVQYSRASPSPSSRVSTVTVRKSRRSRETPMAAASSTSTLSLPWRSEARPLRKKGRAPMTLLATRSLNGRKGRTKRKRIRGPNPWAPVSSSSWAGRRLPEACRSRLLSSSWVRVDRTLPSLRAPASWAARERSTSCRACACR